MANAARPPASSCGLVSACPAAAPKGSGCVTAAVVPSTSTGVVAVVEAVVPKTSGVVVEADGVTVSDVGVSDGVDEVDSVGVDDGVVAGVVQVSGHVGVVAGVVQVAGHVGVVGGVVQVSGHVGVVVGVQVSGHVGVVAGAHLCLCGAHDTVVEWWPWPDEPFACAAVTPAPSRTSPATVANTPARTLSIFMVSPCLWSSPSHLEGRGTMFANSTNRRVSDYL